MLVGSDELAHAQVLIVRVRVVRYLHDSGYELVQSVFLREGAAKLHVNNGDIVSVLAVHAVVPCGCFGSLQFQQRLVIVHVGVRLNPLRGDFLYGAAVAHGVALERSQPVIPALAAHDGAADAVDQRVDELVQVHAVHRVEQIVDCSLHSSLRWVRNTLLEIVRGLQPRLFHDCVVVYCHFSVLLS